LARGLKRYIKTVSYKGWQELCYLGILTKILTTFCLTNVLLITVEKCYVTKIVTNKLLLGSFVNKPANDFVSFQT
jgi:hypothetical protein